MQQGNTALHLATIHNHSDCVLLLADNYAQLDVTNQVWADLSCWIVSCSSYSVSRSQRSHTPLHTAVELGLADIVELLLIAGANIDAREKVRPHIVTA